MEAQFFIASITLIGSVVGTPVGGLQSDILGRKNTMMATQLLTLIGFLFLRFAQTIPMFYIGAFLGGYTEGVYLFVSALYTAEINQPKIRNYTMSFNMLSYFLMFCITYVIAYSVPWRQTISILIPLPCLNFLWLFFCPESPTWYMLKGRKEEAFTTLLKLRGNSEVARLEIKRIEKNLEEQKSLQEKMDFQASSIKEHISVLLKGTFVRPCSVLVFLYTIGWQWTGEASLTFYTVDIVQEFNIPVSPYLTSAGIGCYQFLVAIISVYLSSVIPRRKYYIGSGILVMAGACILGAYCHLQKYKSFHETVQTNPILHGIPIFALLLYFGGYASGFVTVCHMLLGELLPSNARSIGGCIVVQSSNVSFFLVTKFTPFCAEALGMDGLFWLFSVITFVSVIFAYCCVPETFGVSLEDIEQHYREICYPSKFTNEYKNGLIP